MATKRPKIHFASVDEILCAPVPKDATTEIRIDQIRPFEHHPFKVVDDERMAGLVESIRNNGVLVPVLVRPDDEGTYEMISGHRRMHAAKLAGLVTSPAVIKEMTDDDATIAMVDANIQREEILPSERAFSLKMKMDAMRHQGKKLAIEEQREEARRGIFENDYGDFITSDTQCRKLDGEGLTSDTQCRKLESIDDSSDTQYRKVEPMDASSDTECRKYENLGKDKGRNVEMAWIVGEKFGLKGVQVRKYIRLTHLKDELLKLVDEKKLSIALGVEISYFNQYIQQWLYEYVKDNGFLKPQQIAALKQCRNINQISQSDMITIMNAALPHASPNGKIQFSRKTLDQYFPASYSTKDRERVLLGLLKQWHDQQESEGMN